MRSLLYSAIMASTILCQPLAQTALFSTTATAQPAPTQQTSPVSAGETAQPGIQQMMLTEKQIEGLIAAQAAINAIIEKIPENQLENPSPKIQAMLDKTARQYGFKDYGEYEDVTDNIGFILEGFDQEKKAFVGHETILKSQISDLESDKKISAQDKDAQLKELKDMLKSVEPVKFPGNIALVTKYYDKLSEIFSDDE